VCLGDTTVSGPLVRGDTTMCLDNTTVSGSPVRVDATVCPGDATVLVLQNAET